MRPGTPGPGPSPTRTIPLDPIRRYQTRRAGGFARRETTMKRPYWLAAFAILAAALWLIPAADAG